MRTHLSLEPRQIVVAVAAGTIILVVMCFQYLLFPVYDDWCELRASIEIQEAEYTVLTRNLAAKSGVDEQFRSLDEGLWQSGSGQDAYSRFLSRLEMLARREGVTMVNAKPFPVQDELTHSAYNVKLSLAGKLQQLLKFTSALTDGSMAVGIDSIRLKAIQGLNMVECTMSVSTIRLRPESPTQDNSSEIHLVNKNGVTNAK